MILAELLPFERYTLTTRLSAEEVYQKLSDNIEPEKTFRLNLFNATRTKPYEGVITRNSFNIGRIIYYRNSFKPVITGQISSEQGKTVIKIKMRLYLAVMIFICCWLAGTGSFCLFIATRGLLTMAAIREQGFATPDLLPFLMFTAVLLMTLIGFKIESKKSKRFFASLLEEEN